MSNIVNTLVKGFLTVLFWAGAIAVSIVAITNNSGGNSGAEAVLPFVMALLATITIWGIPEVVKIYESRSGRTSEESYEKGKREQGSRRIEQLALLLEMMDPDEQEQFKQSLKQRVLDGGYDDDDFLYSDETLESLMQEKRSGKRLQQ